MFIACKTVLIPLMSSVFGSTVAVAFQSVFYSEMYRNNIFFIFLKLFLTLAYQNDLNILKKY